MPVTLREFVKWFESVVPPALQEDYDNSGLQVGDPSAEVSSVMLTLDVTPDVVSEASVNGCNLIVSHHPLIFRPLRRLTWKSDTERSVAMAVENGIAVYSAHTSLDNHARGVSHRLAKLLGLEDIRILEPREKMLVKLVTFVPGSHATAVRKALFGAGAGWIGNYDMCSFNAPGEGTYRAGPGATPFAGSPGSMHIEPEIRIEVILPEYLTGDCIRALTDAHPYEEPAYDIIPLANSHSGAGAGAVGNMPVPVTGTAFLTAVKELTNIPVIRYCGDPSRTVRRVALCGGAGAGLLEAAARAGADAFITGDIKYHTFAGAPANMIVADIGHYESEKFSLQLLQELIIEKFPKFALRFSATNTNPINYF